MKTRISLAIHNALSARFPEKRLFLRSDTETRFIRLSPETQLLAITGAGLVIAWAIIATAIMFMDNIGSGNYRAQAMRDQSVYEDRLSALAQERDTRAREAKQAHDRFDQALAQISAMQTELLSSEDHSREMETGLEVIQSTLRRIMQQRDEARLALDAATGESSDDTAVAGRSDGEVDLLAEVLAETAAERDKMEVDAQAALDQANEMQIELELLQDKNDYIFRQLEEAMLVSVAPIEKMFRDAGMDPDRLIGEVRRGYSGTGGPLTPMGFSDEASLPDESLLRANAVLTDLDRINLYRIAAEKAPFTMPVRSGYRFTSGFGPRWGRMHNGLDFAAPIGTPIYAPADGEVIFAGWSSGYGRLVKVRHAFGIETRYAHQSRIRVSVGQKLSRGDRIGDIGNSGRSTGPHLHYEIRVGGKPVNPMTYIRAGEDVF